MPVYELGRPSFRSIFFKREKRTPVIIIKGTDGIILMRIRKLRTWERWMKHEG